MGTFGLHALDDADCYENDYYRDSNAKENNCTSEGKAQNDGRQYEKHSDQVEDGEPAILCCFITEEFSHWNGKSCERNWVKEKNSRDVEE